MRLRATLFAGALLPFSMAWGGDDHGHEDFVVGRTGAGQLAVEFDIAELIELPPASGLIQGWAAADTDIMNLKSKKPEEDFFVLDSGAQIIFELVSIDPAFKLWSPGFGSLLDTPADEFVLGTSDFDIHLTFHIDTEDLAFDPSVDTFAVGFRLRDDGVTGYAPSSTMTANFIAVPEPAALLLLSVGAIAFVRPGSRRPVR